MKSGKAAIFILVCAFVWLALQASLLFQPSGILATYDLPTHLHLASAQLQNPTVLWDNAWYAGYPTYAYPPLAHRFAAEMMKWLGHDAGFKAAVAGVYVLCAAVVYIAARTTAVLPPLAAAWATLLVAVSPALFRAFLFGQYPSLMSFLFFWGSFAALFATLSSKREDPRLATLGALLLALLGSIHLYAMVLVLLVMPLLSLVFPAGKLIRRLMAPVMGGAALALLPSLALLVDRDRFAKAVVPHITRSAQMVVPQGLLEWVLAPAGLPMIVGLLVVVPHLISRKWGTWTGILLITALVWYLQRALSGYWLLFLIVNSVLLILAIRKQTRQNPHRIALFLGLAGIISVWLSLGPHGGLARLLPYSDILVYDRFLLLGAPFGFFAIVRALWPEGTANVVRGPLVGALGITTLLLMGFSLMQVIEHYRHVVPGAQGRFPQGTAIPQEILDVLKADRGYGRVLPLGLPRVAYILPDTTGRPLIDGAYNDARQLDPLRRSGLETLGDEKFIDAELRLVRFFLTNAEAYGIKWVITGDRFYEKAIPLDDFTLVLEPGADPDRSVRLYRSIYELGQAWEGPRRHRVAQMGMVGTERLGPVGTGGGTLEVDRVNRPSMLGLIMQGSTIHGWAFTELDLKEHNRNCNQIAFRAWSPTGTSLAIRTLRRDQWLSARPEMALSPRPQWITIAVDCPEVKRLRLVFAGSGFHQVFMSPVILRRVQTTTASVPFQQLGPECFRVAIPANDRPVTVSLASFPRWQAMTPGATVHMGRNELGLLTVRGPSGDHRVCLAFPPIFRSARAVLPIIYVGIAALALVLLLLRRSSLFSPVETMFAQRVQRIAAKRPE